MTAQTSTYGMDYLNHAQPKDVLVWIRMNVDILPDVGSKISKLFNHKGTLTIPCHQFAASVVVRFEGLLDPMDQQLFTHIAFDCDGVIFLIQNEAWDSPQYNCSINPFHGMTMPDGSPRTSCTREEFDEWKKELE